MTSEQRELRNIIGNVDMPGGDIAHGWDNLAIALCSYYSRHMDRPDPDPDTEHGWGAWVEQKCNEALDAIAAKVARRSPEPRTPAPELPPGEREAFEAWWKREVSGTEHNRWDYDKGEFWWVWQAARRSAPAPAGWHSIESAPPNEPVLMANFLGQRMFWAVIGQRVPPVGHFTLAGDGISPTHWVEANLPEPPK